MDLRHGCFKSYPAFTSPGRSDLYPFLDADCPLKSFSIKEDAQEQGLSPVTERLTQSEEFLSEAVAERQAVLSTS